VAAEKKVELIRAENPTWEDLAAGWGEAAVMTVSRKSRFLTGLSAPFGMTSLFPAFRSGLEPMLPVPGLRLVWATATIWMTPEGRSR